MTSPEAVYWLIVVVLTTLTILAVAGAGTWLVKRWQDHIFNK